MNMTKEQSEKTTLILSGIGVGFTAILAISALLWLIINLSLGPLEEKVSSVDSAVKNLQGEVKEVKKQIMSKDEIEIRMDAKVAAHRIESHSK